jgi:hypothetical protein
MDIAESVLNCQENFQTNCINIQSVNILFAMVGIGAPFASFVFFA